MCDYSSHVLAPITCLPAIRRGEMITAMSLASPTPSNRVDGNVFSRPGETLDLRDADRNSRNAALTLTFLQPGVTLLYLLLPLHHDAFGVTLAEAGLLLAATRLVRIAGYGWVARLFAERCPHAACLLAPLGSLLSTLGYATLSGVWG